MKKSSQVPASLVVALSAGLASSGCSPRVSTWNCTDAYGNRLPDSACTGGRTIGAHWIRVQSGGFGGSGGFFGGGSGSGGSFGG